jgi:hypothetical protein
MPPPRCSEIRPPAVVMATSFTRRRCENCSRESRRSRSNAGQGRYH